MIKVFLVEDEYAIREGIKKTIRWERDGFELVGEAGSRTGTFSSQAKRATLIPFSENKMPSC